MNPIMRQLIQLFKGGSNPMQLAMNFLAQVGGGNNPIIQNAANLAQGGNVAALEQVARNIAQQKGYNFDQAYSEFLGYFK